MKRLLTNQLNFQQHSWLMLLMMLLFSASTFAADEAKEEKIIAKIADKAQFNQNYDAGNNWYAYQWYNRELNINLSSYKDTKENLVLTFKLYIMDLDDPDKIPFFSQTDKPLVDLLEVGNANNKLLSWSTKKLNLKPGWNDIRVEFPEASNYTRSNFDITEKITWFRLCYAHVTKGDCYLIRIQDVCLRDKSQLVTPEENGGGTTPDYETNYNVCSLPYSLDETFSHDKNFAVGTKFNTPFDLTKHDLKKLYLTFDAEITADNAAEITYLNNGVGQIELCSGGKNDDHEATFGIGSADWKVGKHTYYIPLATHSNSGGEIDWSNLNYMRIYLTRLDQTDMKGTIHLKVNNVKVVDFTTKTVLPALFSDGMMFQQNKAMNIWGYGAEGKKITVEFLKGETSLGKKEATVGADGKWIVSFDGRAASYDKYSFKVMEGETLIQEVKDILIGEVWVAGGQSNMALTVGNLSNHKDVLAAAKNDNIRVFIEPTKPTGETSPYEPEKDIAGAFWGHGNNADQMTKVSAVAYYMVKNLQAKLNIPVGFLYTPIGGSVIEAWLPREQVEASENAELKDKLNRMGLYNDMSFWVNGATTITGFYNAKVGPLKGYNVAGALWYQGESNSGRAELYAQEIQMLKEGWEKTFGFEKGTMPFVYTEVAPWVTNLTEPQFLAKLAEAMEDGFKKINDNKTGFFPIYDTDLDYTGNVVIHPTNKKPVGDRFATAIYNMVYGKAGKEFVCPMFDNLTVQGNKIVVKFVHVGEGLKTIDGTKDVHGFAIAGEDGVYVNASAKIISKDEVEVWNPGLNNPKNVTYAYATWNINSNLANSENFPAAPFRSSRAEGQKYYNPMDWTLADAAQIWSVTAEKGDNNNTKNDFYTKFQDAWKANTVKGTATPTLTFDTEVKAEGKASLKVAYDATTDGVIGVGPVLDYKSIVLQLANFKSLSVQVKNADNRNKTIQLLLKSGDKVFTASTENGLVAKNADFATVLFQLDALKDEKGAAVTDAAKVLAGVTDLQFTINDKQTGTVYLDNVMFTPSKLVATGISEVNAVGNSEKNEVTYNLLGQKVNTPSNGVFIQNHKKVIIK